MVDRRLQGRGRRSGDPLRPDRRALTLDLEPAGATVLGSAMPAGSNEPDGVLSYQVGPASRPSPGLSLLHPLSLFLPLPQRWTLRPLSEGKGRPSRDTRGRSGRLGLGQGLREGDLGPNRELPLSAASLAWLVVTSVLLGSSLLGESLASGPRRVVLGLGRKGGQGPYSGGASLLFVLFGGGGFRKSWNDWSWEQTL